MAGKWIQAAHLDTGSFTAKAKAAGEGVQEYAQEKKNAPGKLGKQARLAIGFKKMANKRKKKKSVKHGGEAAGMLHRNFGRAM